MKYLINQPSGSVFAVIDGELVAYPILADNTFDSDEFVVVDFNHVDSESSIVELRSIEAVIKITSIMEQLS